MIRSKIKHSGFTLVELLVVVAIIAILMGIVMGISGIANRKSAEAKVTTEMQQIANVLEEYRIKYGRYPDKLIDADKLHTDLHGKKMPLADYWGRTYEYTNSQNALSYTFKSKGVNLSDAGDDLDLSSGN